MSNDFDLSIIRVSTYCRLALIQLHAASQTALGEQPQLGDDELVEL
jgi:hypothetical protein